MLIFALVGIGHVLDKQIIGSGSVLRNAIIIFYLPAEGIAILENAIHLGLVVPEILRSFLKELHKHFKKKDK